MVNEHWSWMANGCWPLTVIDKCSLTINKRGRSLMINGHWWSLTSGHWWTIIHDHWWSMFVDHRWPKSIDQRRSAINNQQATIDKQQATMKTLASKKQKPKSNEQKTKAASNKQTIKKPRAQKLKSKIHIIVWWNYICFSQGLCMDSMYGLCVHVNVGTCYSIWAFIFCTRRKAL